MKGCLNCKYAFKYFREGLSPCPDAFSEISNKCKNYVKEEIERGKDKVYEMSVIILTDKDIESLQNGKMLHLQVDGEQTVGLASEKWANEHPDDEATEEESKKLYLVYGNTYFDEYGEYINVFGIFTSMELAEIAKKNAEDRYYEDEKEKTFPVISARDEVNFEIKEINVDEEIDIKLGGYVE